MQPATKTPKAKALRIIGYSFWFLVLTHLLYLGTTGRKQSIVEAIGMHFGLALFLSILLLIVYLIIRAIANHKQIETKFNLSMTWTTIAVLLLAIGGFYGQLQLRSGSLQSASESLVTTNEQLRNSLPLPSDQNSFTDSTDILLGKLSGFTVGENLDRGQSIVSQKVLDSGMLQVQPTTQLNGKLDELQLIVSPITHRIGNVSLHFRSDSDEDANAQAFHFAEVLGKKYKSNCVELPDLISTRTTLLLVCSNKFELKVTSYSPKISGTGWSTVISVKPSLSTEYGTQFSAETKAEIAKSINSVN